MFYIMKDFYEEMTFLAVYDGHRPNGRYASDLVNSSIRNYKFTELLFNFKLTIEH